MTDYSHWPPAVARVCEAAQNALHTFNGRVHSTPCLRALGEIDDALAALRAARPGGVGEITDSNIEELGSALERACDGEGENYLSSSFYTNTSKGIGLACAAIDHLQTVGFLPAPPVQEQQE